MEFHYKAVLPNPTASIAGPTFIGGGGGDSFSTGLGTSGGVLHLINAQFTPSKKGCCLISVAPLLTPRRWCEWEHELQRGLARIDGDTAWRGKAEFGGIGDGGLISRNERVWRGRSCEREMSYVDEKMLFGNRNKGGEMGVARGSFGCG
ncbi:unnamed protein product [Vicia faba]|uniref:Uncharacterized protein n=1 Tax=Vicia faba TaxID=3906 RepID=A0AAV0ZYZ0_VICFA|nr:unnamed protein product [Vicia faba]